jgi:fumarate reductase flavoprotein subunit
MEQDIQHKADWEADPLIVNTVCQTSGRVIDWLMQNHAIELTLVEDFLYPGHSRPRMHAPSSRTGSALMNNLLAAAERAGIAIVTNAQVTQLYVGELDKIEGVHLSRPDGSGETLSCDALILACNGYGGNPDLVRQYIPEIADALYFGHSGNQGEAVLWGQALGAGIKHMTAYQGHGSVATPHGILITWALMMEGGIQVNADGLRFSNEHLGYSEQAIAVLSQPARVAWNIYDQRLHDLGMGFEDYRNAWNLGAIKSAPTVQALAQAFELPAMALNQTINDVTAFAAGEKADPFLRSFHTRPVMTGPWYGVKVTGALFHTQGGLMIDTDARVLRTDGSALPNLFAAGGAACGLSGSKVSGYLSGNGLLSAVVLGSIAGRSAAGCGQPDMTSS